MTLSDVDIIFHDVCLVVSVPRLKVSGSSRVDVSANDRDH